MVSGDRVSARHQPRLHALKANSSTATVRPKIISIRPRKGRRLSNKGGNPYHLKSVLPETLNAQISFQAIDSTKGLQQVPDLSITSQKLYFSFIV